MDANTERYYDFMRVMGIATEDELSLALALCGTNENTMKKVLYIKTGYNSLEQIDEEFEEEEMEYF